MTAKLALFALGGRRFALPVEAIMHILMTPQVFPLPLLRPDCRGVMLHNDDVLPCFDLSQKLGIDAGSTAGSGQYTILYGTEAGVVGLPVDQVLQIVDRGRGTVETVDAEPGARGLEESFVFDGNGYPLLDVASLVAFPPVSLQPAPSPGGNKEA